MDLALFDFDGTITVSDTFLPFIHRAVPPPRAWLGTVLLSPLIVGYRLRRVPATTARAAASFVAFRGRAEREVCELGRRYASSLRAGMRGEALERIAWHQARGDRVVIVSASLEPYLAVVARELGVELICTELEARRGILTGRYAGGDCTGREKARRVLARYELARYASIYAYGDTPEDHELLQLASKRYYRWRELDPSAAPPLAGTSPA